jgi:UDP-2,4-diacetamido-2,4,6-trideoxy-beta-L-altropyranose hydrolase
MSTLLIRADASTRIGTGHVMRSLALAEVWQSMYGRVVLVSCGNSKSIATCIQDAGIEFCPINSIHPDPSDLQTTLQRVRLFRAVGVVTDGYHFDISYQQSIRQAGYPLLVIDDFFHLPRYEADLLLNQNISACTMKYSCNRDAQLLLGTQYALLRSQFVSGGRRQTFSELARRVLVSLGGADPQNVTLKVVRALMQIRIDDMEVLIVLGSSNPHKDVIQDAVRNATPKIQVVCNAPNMPGLMAWADVAIAAGGITSLELAFMGTPCILLVLADNQARVAEGMEQAGIAWNLGWHQLVSEQELSKAVSDLILDSKRRRLMSENGRKDVDGRGACRVAEALYLKATQKLSNASSR